MSASLFLVALAVSLTHAERASAGDKEQCIEASEDGQRARVAGRLIESRAHFVTCARAVCPTIVRSACAGWLDEVERAQPSISVGVQDGRGRDVLDASILVDGRPPPEHGAGRSFPIDPGSHVVRAEVNGKLYEEHVLVKEGEKARAITVRLPASGEPSRPEPVTLPPPSSPQPGRSIGPFLVLGAGIVATGVGLGVFFSGAGAFPDNCRTDTATSERGGTCAKTPEDPTGAASTDAAVSAVNQRNTGLGIVAGGGALLVGGLVWWLLDAPAPAPSKAAAMRVSPVLAPAFSGLAWIGAF